MNELIVVITLFLVTFIGSIVFEYFNLLSGMTRFSKLPYWFGLGLGIIAFELFLFSLLSIQWDLRIIIAPLLFFTLIYLFYKKIVFSFSIQKIKFSLYEKGLLIGIASLLLFIGFETVLRPLSAYDGWAIWVLKAKMFYLDGFVNPHAYHLLKENYPYLINLDLVFLMKIIGRNDDSSILLLFYSFYLLSAIALFTILRKYTTRLIALIFTFLFVSTQNVMRHGGRFESGYADLALGFYILLIANSLINFIKKMTFKNLIVVELMLVIASLIKEEGFFFSLVVNFFIVLIILYKRQFKLLLSIAIYVVPQFLWQYFKIQNDLHYSLYAPITIHSGRSVAIFLSMLIEMIDLKNWNLLWISYIVGLFLLFRLKDKTLIVIPSLIAVQIVGYFIIFTLSPHNPIMHIQGVMNRLLLHVAPLGVFYLGLIFYKLLGNKQS